MSVWRSVVAAMVLACVCVSASAQQAGRRVALVIGNSAYASQGTLANPGPDSRLVADALRRVGFAVIPVNDAGKPAMERALRDFSRQADGAEVALVYYAGHGMEANGVNWLLPVDAQLADERDLSFEAISLDTVLATVERARGLRMVVLDACRNNPFARSMRRSVNTRATVTRGLADVEVTGTLVLYAARGGTVAQDGPAGGNSPFAAAFARRIPEPGVDIRLLVSKVRDDVLAATGKSQEPFSYGSLPGIPLRLVTSSSPLEVNRERPATAFFSIEKVPEELRAVVAESRSAYEKASEARSRAEVAATEGRAMALRAENGAPGTSVLQNQTLSYKGDETSGYGVYEAFGAHLQAGLKYAGQFENGVNHGYGVSDYRGRNTNDELEYAGEYQGGRRVGYGVVMLKQGQIWGRFEGAVTGAGVFKFTTGEVYEGELSQNGPHGRGVWWSASGEVEYSGTWINGKPQGAQRD